MSVSIQMTEKNYARFEDEAETNKEPDSLKGSEIKKPVEHKVSKLKTTKFDAFAIPANLEMARDHLQATRIAKEIISTKQNVDDQSGFPVDNELVSLNCDLNELSFLSPGYPMYFQFIKLTLYFTTIILITSSLFSIWSNMSGHDCIPEKDLDDETRRDFDKLILVCIKKASAIFSLANRRTDSSSHHLQEIFNLLTVIILVGVNRIFKKTVHDTGVKLDEEVVSASDYTIRVTNIPNDFADHEDIDKEIQKFISHAVPDKKLDVQRINVVYKMKEKEELYAKLKKLVRDAEKIKAKRVKGAGKMSIKKLIIAKTDELHQLNLLEDEIDSIKHTVEVMSAKFKSGKNVKEYFTGEAYLTFETQAGK